MTVEPAPCDPNWRDDPAGLDRLCDIGRREYHGNTATRSRDTDTVRLTGEYL